MIRTIILIVVIVLVLSFFGISIREVINSPTGQENFGFLGNLVEKGWGHIVELSDSFVSFLAGIFQPISFSK